MQNKDVRETFTNYLIVKSYLSFLVHLCLQHQFSDFLSDSQLQNVHISTQQQEKKFEPNHGQITIVL